MLKNLTENEQHADELEARRDRPVSPLTPSRPPAKLNPDGTLAAEAGGTKAGGALKDRIPAPEPKPGAPGGKEKRQ